MHPSAKGDRPVPPVNPPDEAALREAALSYLARYSATQASLLRVLSRRVTRWARAADAPAEATEAPMQAARAVVARLVAAGAVDDAAFAAGRARTLRRAGRSSRAIAAHLYAKGVQPDAATLPDDPAAELAAALLYAARRRMGPFRPEPDQAERPRDLARLARAGFPAATAHAALALSADEAEALLHEARRW